MKRIRDFRCSYDNPSGFGEWVVKDFDIRFPEAYLEEREGEQP